MSEKTFLYVTKDEVPTISEGNEKGLDPQVGIKDRVKDAFEGIKTKEGASAIAKFDRAEGAFELVTEGLTKAQTTKLHKALGDVMTPEAQQRWAEDRQANLAAMATVRSEAKARTETTKEPAPKAKSLDGIAVYPAPSEKAEFKQALVETGSSSAYHKARADVSAHFRVVTESPEAFQRFQGPEAEARFKAEYAEIVAGKKAASPDMETARGAAEKRAETRDAGGKAFMANYKDKGFTLGKPENAKNYDLQMGEMRSSSTKQLFAVLQKSRARLAELTAKEANGRAEAAGIPVEQVKGMPWSEQKALGGGLKGADFVAQQGLIRGVTAIDNELTNERGISAKKSKGTEASKEAKSEEKAKPVENQQTADKPKTRGPAEISAEDSAGMSMEAMTAAMANRQGRGR